MQHIGREFAAWPHAGRLLCSLQEERLLLQSQGKHVYDTGALP